MKSFTLCTFLLLTLSCSRLNAQHRCGNTLQKWKQLTEQPAYRELYRQAVERMQNQLPCFDPANDTVTIPVVVHIVYNTPEQNISDEQVQSQIDALNEDYAATNATTADIPGVWADMKHDSRIRFCLASRSPSGTHTNGITRTSTNVTQFYSPTSTVKFDSSGGADAWPANSYLNMWVCNLYGGVLGYASLPGDGMVLEEDGVVIHFLAFGRRGNLNKKYDLGRSCTHEVGHWLHLRHIWGDEDQCLYDDDIDDTPLQETFTFDSPNFPQTDMCSGGDGIMFMNYMDYTDDDAMMFFTRNQTDTMRRYFGLFRDSICLSPGCTPASTLLHDLELEAITSPVTITGQRCFRPVVRVRNNGMDTVTRFTIVYNIVNATRRMYSWSGVLPMGQAVNVELPLMSGEDLLNILEARIAETDSNTTNNYRSRSYMVTKDNTAGCDDGDPFVYPNPVTTGTFCVRSRFTTSDNLIIRVVNLLGQKVFEALDLKSNPGDVFPVNLGLQPKGVYLVQLISGEESRGSKIIYLPGEGAMQTQSICN